VQVPGAGELGCEDGAEALGLGAREEAILEDSRRVDHAAKRREGLADPLQHLGQARAVGDVRA
jgi:hypothetical protein